MTQSLTFQCVVALILGVLAGTAAAQLQPEALAPWLSGADGAIRVWTNALRLVVTPLVVAQLFVAVSSQRVAKEEAARLGVLIPAVFVGLLIFTALIALAAAAGLLRLPLLEGLSLAATEGPSAASQAVTNGVTGSPSWLDQLVPANLFAAASSDALLGLILFTLAFGIAAKRIAPELRQALETGFQAIRDAMFVLVDWLLRLAPLLLFALAFRSATSSGLAIGGVLLAYALLAIMVLLLCTAALYPLAVLAGGVRLSGFARAAFPAQVTGATTRSSLATLPVLLRESEATLRIPPNISALVLPVGGALLKLSRAVSSPIKLLFLAQLLGLSLGPQQLLIFTVTILLLSPTSPGIPRVISGTRSMPAFIAAGVPPEYVVLLGATNAVTDSFQTMLNSTGYLTANVLVTRLFRRRRAVADGLPAAAAAPQPATQQPGP